jgi:tRNA(Arg) A34 adenosine deaminase TadA
MCFGAVHWSRLDRLYFAASRHDARAIGFDDALLYEQLALALDQRALPTTQHLAAEARAMMQRWLQVPDDRRY